MIHWFDLFVVAVATLVSATITVSLYSTGVRLRAVAADAKDEGRHHLTPLIAAWVCFLLCLGVVILGIYLIVPALHGG